MSRPEAAEVVVVEDEAAAAGAVVAGGPAVAVFPGQVEEIIPDRAEAIFPGHRAHRETSIDRHRETLRILIADKAVWSHRGIPALLELLANGSTIARLNFLHRNARIARERTVRQETSPKGPRPNPFVRVTGQALARARDWRIGRALALARDWRIGRAIGM
jgi:hypothetical protein